MNHVHIVRFKAFTLIELLVVISVVTLLIALLVPAIVGARESELGPPIRAHEAID